MLDADGETTDRWLGFTKEMFLERLGAALADQTTIDEKQERFAAQPTVIDATTLARYHDSRSEYATAVALYRRAQELDPDGDYSMEIFSCIFNGARRSEAFDLADARAAADAVVASPRADAIDVLRVADMMASAAANAGEPAMMLPYLSAAFARSANSKEPAVQRMREELEPLHALHVDRDAERAISLKKASMDEGWMEDDGALNSFAWWCFENRVNLDEALVLAEKGVALAEPGARKAMILDTAAEICNLLDDCQRAVELMQQAVEEEPGSARYKKQLARFEERLAAMH